MNRTMPTARRKKAWEREPHFDGRTYNPGFDHERLTGQLKRVKDVMFDGAWRTLDEIGSETGDPPASVSARLRDLRKEKFGQFTVERRRRGDPKDGLFEYRVLIPLSAEKVGAPRPAKIEAPLDIPPEDHRTQCQTKK